MAKAKSNFSVDAVKKNLFWIFVPVAILAVWGVFFIANAKAKANYLARVQELETLRKAVGDIKGNSKHPNQGTIDDAKVQEQLLRSEVYRSWERMYEAQKLNCTWSTKLHPKFRERIENLKWMEPIPGVEVREWYNTFMSVQIPEFLEMANRRTVYVRIPDPFKPGEYKKDANGQDLYVPLDPYVAEPDAMLQQNAQSISSGTGMGGMMGGGSMGGGGMGGGSMGGGGMGGGSSFTSFSTTASGSMGGGGVSMGGGSSMGVGMGNEMSALGGLASNAGTTLDSIFDSAIQKVEGIVDWPTPEIFTIVTWTGQSPYSGQIWIAQEEVWVYESLINVVRKINERVEATGPHNAAIKRIQAMLIGKNAANIVRSPGILEPLGSSSGMGMDMMGGMGEMGGSSMGGPAMGGAGGTGGDMSMMEGGMMSSGPMSEEDTIAYLKKYRYVDEELKPLSDSDSPPFAEFNMMPVCLELIVDQRKLPEILVECANSTMPIDIKLVRYNPANARTGLLGSSMGGMGGMGGMDSMMGGSGGMMGPGSGASSPGGRTGSAAGGGLGGSGGMGSGSDPFGAAADALSGFEVGGKIGVYGSDAVMIQIVGVISIYNEPDPKLLATGASAQESGLEGGVSQEILDQVAGAEDNADTDTAEYSLAPPATTTDDSDTLDDHADDADDATEDNSSEDDASENNTLEDDTTVE